MQWVCERIADPFLLKNDKKRGWIKLCRKLRVIVMCTTKNKEQKSNNE